MACINDSGPLATDQGTWTRKTGRGRQPRSIATNSKSQQSKPMVVAFINAMHPDDNTSSQSLSLIRSHVAKHGRALQRERKQNQQNQSAALLRYGSPKRSYIHEHDEEEEEDGEARNITSQHSAHSSSVAKTRFRLLAPKSRAPVQTRTAGSTDVHALSPIQLIGGARKDAYQGFARALSNDEQRLFDFYLTYVIEYGYKSCYHKETEAVFQASMREIWVPFAMANATLMAAIFQIACRNYVANTNNDNTEKFAIKKLQYRLTCLSAARDAIACQTVASDATIFLALLMASESFYEGEMDAFYAHGNGIIKMVTDRGGLGTLGVSGFLEKSVAWSIYSPMHNLVMGPEEAELDHFLQEDA